MAENTYELSVKFAIINIYELLMKNKFARKDIMQKLADMFDWPYFLPFDPDLLEKMKEKLFRSREQLQQIEECLYEYIRRVKCHKDNKPKTSIICNAKKFQNILNISDFKPYPNWCRDFLINYNISSENGFTCETPVPFFRRSIIKYCEKNFSANANKINLFKTEITENHVDLSLSEDERWAKVLIELLELSLKEFIKRATVHHESLALDDKVLQQKALELNAVLKLPDFKPNIDWLQNVKKTVIKKQLPPANEIPLSLNLLDIISYCCEMVHLKYTTTEFTLSEKLAMISIYELINNKFKRQDCIQDLADMFNCSMIQIGYLLPKDPGLLAKNKEKLLKSYGRLKQIEVYVYEYIQRLQYHRKMKITDRRIILIAEKYQKFLKIPDFTPNTKWCIQFKINYNIRPVQNESDFSRHPPMTLNIKHIIKYCDKNFGRNSIVESPAQLNPPKVVGWYKINLELLELSVKEYMRRVTVHHKSIELDDVVLKQVALELNAVFKLTYFIPNMNWLQEVKTAQTSKHVTEINLDLMNILSYCCKTLHSKYYATKFHAPKQRRKVHTLDTSVSALNMYQKVQNYFVVDESMGIERNAVKNIVENSQDIIKNSVQQEYTKIRTNIIKSDYIQQTLQTPQRNLHSMAQDKKQELLEKCVYETLKRKKGFINMESITITALDFRDIMDLKGFEVSKRWLSYFKNKYGIQFSNQELVAPESVDLHEVFEYCKLSLSDYKDVLLVLKPLEEYATKNQNLNALACIEQLERHLKNTHRIN